MTKAEILSETEGEPQTRPSIGGLSPAASALAPGLVWRRLEAWTAWRWGVRPVTWLAEGPGLFLPRIGPATLGQVEEWRDGAWQAVTADPSPLGGVYLPGATAYRIAADVGSTETVPPEVAEAYRRLAEYLGQVQGDDAPGATELQDGDYSIRRPAAWAARALAYSGAADLLRGFR